MYKICKTTNIEILRMDKYNLLNKVPQFCDDVFTKSYNAFQKLWKI